MKKFMFAAALLLTAYAQAQIIELRGKNNAIIEDGDTYITDELGVDGEASLPLKVRNLTNEDIYVKLKMNETENADNMTDFMVQFCFGTMCYTEVAEGDIVPTNIDLAIIEALGENPDGDKFANGWAGDTAGAPVVYNMALVQYNADNTPGDTLITFSYIYDPTAGVNDIEGLQNLGISVKNTIVNTTLELDAAHKATLQLFDINGKLVKTMAVAEGIQALDLSGLTTSVYIARFVTEGNKTANIRIVKN